jgi:hypothetical protein
MISLNRALKDDGAMKATIGLSASEFDQLAQSFGPEIEKEGWHRYEKGFEQGNRKRKPWGGRIGNLKSSTEKVIFDPLLFQVLSNFRRLRAII